MIPLALLAGCSDLPQARTESEIREIARTVGRDDIAKLQLKIVELEGEIRKLRADNEFQDKYIDLALDGAEATAKQVSENARIANENTVKDMTARGACGTRPVYRYADNGQLTSITNEKIPCTLKDLRR